MGGDGDKFDIIAESIRIELYQESIGDISPEELASRDCRIQQAVEYMNPPHSVPEPKFDNEDLVQMIGEEYDLSRDGVNKAIQICEERLMY